MFSPYTEWRTSMEALNDLQQWASLMALGYRYNFRLWHQHPRLRRPTIDTKFKNDPAKTGQTIRVDLSGQFQTKTYAH